jgi:hypothetical protein
MGNRRKVKGREDDRRELSGREEKQRSSRGTAWGVKDCSAQTRTGMGHLRRPPGVELIPAFD